MISENTVISEGRKSPSFCMILYFYEMPGGSKLINLASALMVTSS